MNEKIPEIVKCAKCGKNLDPHIHHANLPEDVSENDVTRDPTAKQQYLHFFVSCPCNHFTEFALQQIQSPT